MVGAHQSFAWLVYRVRKRVSTRRCPRLYGHLDSFCGTIAVRTRYLLRLPRILISHCRFLFLLLQYHTIVPDKSVYVTSPTDLCWLGGGGVGSIPCHTSVPGVQHPQSGRGSEHASSIVPSHPSVDLVFHQPIPFPPMFSSRRSVLRWLVCARGFLRRNTQCIFQFVCCLSVCLDIHQR